MEKPSLNNPQVLPSEEVLTSVLGSAYNAYSILLERMAETSLEPIWNYYRDGGAWLCKVQFKKKTVFWLSVWEGFFKITFYFTENTVEGLNPLPIHSNCFEQIRAVKRVGKFIPLTFEVHEAVDLEDVLLVADYKKKLK
jgi:hypothetical protein